MTATWNAIANGFLIHGQEQAPTYGLAIKVIWVNNQPHLYLPGVDKKSPLHFCFFLERKRHKYDFTQKKIANVRSHTVHTSSQLKHVYMHECIKLLPCDWLFNNERKQAVARFTSSSSRGEHTSAWKYVRRKVMDRCNGKVKTFSSRKAWYRSVPSVSSDEAKLN